MGFAVAALLLLSLGSACARAQQLSATQTAKMSPSNSDLSQPASADSSPQDVQGGHAERGSDGTFVMHENVSEVRLNVTVLDSSGRSIQTLDKEAFHIFEDGAAQTITSFRHEDLPVSLGILIDSSGSMYDKQAAVNAAALDLMKLSNPQDEAFLVDFSWQTMVDQDFTSDISKLQQGLSYITPKGETAVYDALVASADYISKNAKHPKQVLLIITAKITPPAQRSIKPFAAFRTSTVRSSTASVCSSAIALLRRITRARCWRLSPSRPAARPTFPSR